MKGIAAVLASAAIVAAGAAMAQDEPKPVTDTIQPTTPSQSMPQQSGETMQVPTLDALDKDHDGFISSTEAGSSKDIASVFTEADADKNGKLDRMEYANAIKLIQG